MDIASSVAAPLLSGCLAVMPRVGPDVKLRFKDCIEQVKHVIQMSLDYCIVSFCMWGKVLGC